MNLAVRNDKDQKMIIRGRTRYAQALLTLSPYQWHTQSITTYLPRFTVGPRRKFGVKEVKPLSWECSAFRYLGEMPRRRDGEGIFKFHVHRTSIVHQTEAAVRMFNGHISQRIGQSILFGHKSL